MPKQTESKFLSGVCKAHLIICIKCLEPYWHHQPRFAHPTGDGTKKSSQICNWSGNLVQHRWWVNWKSLELIRKTDNIVQNRTWDDWNSTNIPTKKVKRQNKVSICLWSGKCIQKLFCPIYCTLVEWDPKRTAWIWKY